VAYGLGTENRNLPAFIVLPDGMNSPPDVIPERQRASVDSCGAEPQDRARNGQHQELAARIESYELAFRMQSEMPGVVDLKRESGKTLAMYGTGGPDKEADAIGRRCLLARRMLEAGLRLVQVIVMGWDSHDYIDKAHGALRRAIDRPIAALLSDLKRTGLLDYTWLSGQVSSAAVRTMESGADPRRGAAITRMR
jgi:hypothetical protein